MKVFTCKDFLYSSIALKRADQTCITRSTFIEASLGGTQRPRYRGSPVYLSNAQNGLLDLKES